jgi:hypothetical protein
MGEFGRFGIPADGRPIRLGDGAGDVLMELIEESGAVVSKDELSSRVRQGGIVDQSRQSDIRLPRCARGFSADREPIPMVADGVTSLPARVARSPDTGGTVPAEAPCGRAFPWSSSN